MIDLADNSWLHMNLERPETRIIDPRPRVKYLQGHILGAMNLSLSEIFDRDTLALHPEEKLAGIFGLAGIDSDSKVVLYDSYDGQSAAMLAWVLEYLGHPTISILSNYVEGWAKHGGRLLYRPVQNEPKTFRSSPSGLSRANIQQVLQRGETTLLDLRAPDEFQGKISSEPRSGRIPGATNLPWTRLLGKDDTFLRSQSELEELFARAGLKQTNQIMTYCTNGPRAALGYIALQQAGFKDVRVYDGSFHQWARRQDLPVEKGESVGFNSKPVQVSPSPCVIENLPGLAGPE